MLEKFAVKQFCNKNLVTQMTMLVMGCDERGSGRFGLLGMQCK